MSSLRLIIVAVWACLAGFDVSADERLTALARVDEATSGVVQVDETIEIRLDLSQPVPWRVFTLDAPRRVVLDLSEVTWPDDMSLSADAIGDLRTGSYRPGWSRLVLDLAQPFAIQTAALDRNDDGSAGLRITLQPTSIETFAERAGPPPGVDDQGLVTAQAIKDEALVDTGPVRVALDPGHGGRDSGARFGNLRESDIMLSFARELATVLRRAGFEVMLVREDDSFVALETRIVRARAAKADIFLSLHADSLAEGTGDARGATVYTLSEEASDLASRRVAERHDQADILAGVDLSGQTDEISLVLMDIARTETAPRSDRLADALVSGLRGALGRVNNRPRRSANFSVLKAPDIPSVLIELGFLSNEDDRANITDAAWRARAADGIKDALLSWQDDDVLRAELLRQ